MQQEQERADMGNNNTLQSHTASCGDENVLQDESTTKVIPEASCQVEKGVELDGETQGEIVEKEEEVKKTRDEEEGESILPASTSDINPYISAEDEIENSSSCRSSREETATEAIICSQSQDLFHPIQRHQPPTRGFHLTKRDKKIIEKIRSYYEAAAEAEESEAKEEDGQEEMVASRRRNSFSQIPSGLVKQSVSRFDVSGHQEEPESGQSKEETTEAINRQTDQETEPHFPASPISSPSPVPTDAKKEDKANKPISSLDFDAESPAESPTSTVLQDKETLSRMGMNQQSNPNRPVEIEADILDKNGEVCEGALAERVEEKQGKEMSVVATEQQDENSLQKEGPFTTKKYTCKNGTTKHSAENQGVINGHESNQAGPEKPNGKEPSREPLPPTEQCKKTEAKTQYSWARTKHRDLSKTNSNLEGFPSQIKVGRWSYHSRIVAANRALFEGMGSDVTGIGLFEASPVVDPMLMENSERILSKVQTLAQMYSAKASTMKVPLHQKWAGTAQNLSWGSSRLSEHSTQLNRTQTKPKSQTKIPIQTQIQTQTEYQQQSQYQVENSHQLNTRTETKNGTQNPSGVKVQSQTITQTRQQTQVQSQSKMWSQTKTLDQVQNQTKTYSQYQIKSISQENQTMQEERMTTRAESLTNGRYLPF